MTIHAGHFDYELNHVLTHVQPGDPPVVKAQSAHGPLPRFVHYFRQTDTAVIVDFNLPADRNVLAFRRLGEFGVKWTSVEDFSPGVLAWSGFRIVNTQNQTYGPLHLCLIPDSVLDEIFARIGNPIHRFPLAQFTTNGVPPSIPTVSAAALEQIVHEMAGHP